MARGAGAAIAHALGDAAFLAKASTQSTSAPPFSPRLGSTEGPPVAFADAASSCAARVIDMAFEALASMFGTAPHFVRWLLCWCATCAFLP